METKRNTSIVLNESKKLDLNNGIFFTDDQEFADFFKRGKYNNDFSPLVYKETVEVGSSNLLKIRINLELIGYFLVCFKRNEENNNKCLTIIDEVKKLKSEDTFSIENQYPKIKKVIDILNKYDLLFSTFVLENSVPKNFIDFKGYTFNFPFFFIKDVKIVAPKKSNNNKKVLLDINPPFFDFDYAFNLLFSLFASFSLHTAISLFSNENWKGVLFIILSLAILSILNYCIFLIYYDKKAKPVNGHKLIMSLYLSLGSALGLIIGILICQYYLEIQYNGLIVFMDILSFALCVCAIFSSKIIKLFKK